MIAVVTAFLNLDTSVAFLTPVLIYTARSRGEGEAALLYGCLLLSNAGSLFLPGSNLTNLIVLGHFRISGGEFLAHMWAPALAALVVTAAVVGGFERRGLRVGTQAPIPPDRPTVGLGLAAVVAVTVLVVVLPSPALPVALVGLAAAGIRLVAGRERLGHVLEMVGVPVLVGLFGVAVALGTLGRVWSGPEQLLSHFDIWGTALIGAARFGPGQQPPCRLPARRPGPPPPFRPADRPQPRTEPVRHRISGLGAVVADGTVRRGQALGGQSLPHGRGRGAALDGGGAGVAPRRRLAPTGIGVDRGVRAGGAPGPTLATPASGGTVPAG